MKVIKLNIEMILNSQRSLVYLLLIMIEFSIAKANFFERINIF